MFNKKELMDIYFALATTISEVPDTAEAKRLLEIAEKIEKVL